MPTHQLYTATVRPTMEYASTTWGMAAKTNKSRLEKVQNMALRVILGAMKTTPVHGMEKTAGELRNLTLSLTADRFPHIAWTHVYTDGSAEEGMKNVAAESTLDIQMATQLPSRFLEAFSAPTIELKYWSFVQLQSTC